ncbi:LysR family transcriptional regulator [Sandarakinorhabdus rubra]|uniref:LysR family transcriptional regulator n=1 Tax=Sandarakinorhabdus rubra TaxID=2672568 RepID=UPI0013D9FC7C|nr:LysR family transcriptional regulator [Sandarakinorhabdus rubra]
MRLDWNDLRFFLAMLEEGSSKRAAAALKVNQTTCVRRIAMLEAALGVDLFSLENGRYVPTSHALAIREAAMGVNAAAAQFENLARSRQRRVSGSLKVTCEEILVPMVVLPALAELRKAYPEVSTELDVSASPRDIAAGEADVAVRATAGPADDGLVWHRLGEDPLAVYCSHAYPDPPLAIDDLLRHPLICYEVHARHIRDLAPSADIRHVSNSWRAILGLIAAGEGIGIVPKIVTAASDVRIQCCFDLPNQAGIWIIYPQQLKRVPYVRVLQQLIERRFDAILSASPTASA